MAAARKTIQMQKILDCLRGVKTHPCAEYIYLELKKEMPSITLATVYRNLNKLACGGDALKLEVNGEYRFDGDTSMHQHCICRECGEIKDCFREEISRKALREFKSPEFRADNVSIKYYGLCGKCAGKKKGKAEKQGRKHAKRGRQKNDYD